MKVNTGELFSCQTCGLIVTVEEPCGCKGVAIMCCDEPMGRGKASANKAKKRKNGANSQKIIHKDKQEIAAASL